MSAADDTSADGTPAAPRAAPPAPASRAAVSPPAAPDAPAEARAPAGAARGPEDGPASGPERAPQGHPPGHPQGPPHGQSEAGAPPRPDAPGDAPPHAVPEAAPKFPPAPVPDPDPARRTSFYGRRVGKPLRTGQADALARLLPQRGLSLEEVARPETLFASPKRDLYLEIGFGGGEHLVAEAARAPEIGFIGCEPFVNGMASALLGLESAKLTNVRVYHEDAALLLDRLPDGALGRAELLYPDPWPKRRHWKRRFVRAENLDRLARTLRKGAPFRFASDVPDYVDWTLRELAAHPAFRWTATRADDWRLPYDGWPGTRYEAKALKEGRVPTYLTFERV